MAQRAVACPPPRRPQPVPLNPGKSAGVRGAQQEQGRTGLALIGAGGAIFDTVIAVTASSSGGGNANVQPQSQSVSTTP